MSDGGATEIERLLIRIVADANQYEKAIAQVEKTTAAIAQRLESLGKRMSIAITAPMTAAAYVGIREFSKFEDAMTKSTAIMSGVTVELRKEMEATARSISRNSVTAPDKVAEAYYFLASAGLDAKQAMAALPVVEQFATAGAFDMAKATELLADSQSALGLASTDATTHMQNMIRVSDVLVQAGNVANASQEQFAKALTTKSATALAQLNKEMEEGVAVLMVYANQGIKGEMAGERLSIMLRETQRAAIKEKAAWKALGVDAFDPVTGKMKHIADITGQLEKALAGASDKQRYLALETLGFRSESIAAIAPLIGMSDQIRAFEGNLRSAGGATAQVAEKQLKSFASQMLMVRNRIYDAAISIGEILAPHIVTLAGWVDVLVTWFRNLSSTTQEYIVYAAAVAAAVGPILYLFGTMMGSVGSIARELTMLWSIAKALFSAYLVPALTVVGSMFTALLSPIGLVTAAIAAMIAYVIGDGSFSAAWEYVKEVVGSVFTAIYGWMQNFSYNFSELISWLGENWWNIIKDMGQAVWLFLKTLPQNFLASLNLAFRILTAFTGWVTGLFDKLFSKDFLNAIWEGLKSATTAFWGWIKGVGEMIWNWIVSVKDWIMNLFSSAKDPGSFDKALSQVADNMVTGIANAQAQTKSDFAAGRGDTNFFNTAKDIINSDNGFVNPMKDFQSNIKEGPKFKYGNEEIKKQAQAQAKATAEAESQVKPSQQLVDFVNEAEAAKDAKKKKKGGANSTEEKSAAAVEQFSKEAYTTLNTARMMGMSSTVSKGGGVNVSSGATARVGGSLDPSTVTATNSASIAEELKNQTVYLREIRDKLVNDDTESLIP